MAYQDKIKKYQREKFEHYKRINELKINNNEAYIELNVKKLEDILNPYATNNSIALKKEFFAEIEHRSSYIPLDYPLVLEICNSTLTSAEKIIIRNKIKNHFEFETITKQTNLKYLKRKSSFFLIIGILGFIILGILYNFNSLPYIEEVVSFLASFSIWEYAELKLFEEDSLKEDIIRYKLLSKIRIVYDKE